jgi:hypothetical protein
MSDFRPSYTGEADPNAVEWADIDVDSAEKEAIKRFQVVPVGLYEVECVKLEQVAGKAYMSEEKITQYLWTFKFIRNIAGGDLVDTEGKPLRKPEFPVWSGLDAVLITKNGKQPTRMIITALDCLPDGAALGKITQTRFIGKRCHLFVEVNAEPGVPAKNKFKKFTAIPKTSQNAQQPTAPVTPVEPINTVSGPDVNAPLPV